jgi:hypothetical protein
VPVYDGRLRCAMRGSELSVEASEAEWEGCVGQMLRWSLWANHFDLSLSGGAVDGGSDAAAKCRQLLADGETRLLVNDSDAVLAHLRAVAAAAEAERKVGAEAQAAARGFDARVAADAQVSAARAGGGGGGRGDGTLG